MAEGVAQAGRQQIVAGYDKFDLQDYDSFKTRCATYWASPPASTSPHPPPALPQTAAGDLLPLAQAFLAPWKPLITMHKGQIEDMTRANGPIEVLVLDASKTAATMDQMSATFFPHLIAGRSIVVQQDFLWWQQPWIAAQMALLSEFFVPVVFVPRFSVSYLCVKTPTPKRMLHMRLAQMSDRDLIAALREAKAQLQDFDIEKELRRVIKAVRANPGVRKAFKMRKPEP